MSNIITRPLSTAELMQLVLGVNQPWKSIYFIAAYTGIRISDLLDFPWTELPGSRPICEHKTGKKKFLFWSVQARAYWSALYSWGSPRDFLFPYRDPSTYRKSIQADCTSLGISPDRIAFHSLRKTHAVIAFHTGGIWMAKTTMNHSHVSTTERYIETALEFDTGQAFDDIFADGISPGGTKGAPDEQR